MESLNHAYVEWGMAGRPLQGQVHSCDLSVVRPFPDGVLLGVADGLGHGDEAAAAARIVRATLEEHAGEAVTSLIERCHENLIGTRGATVSLASFNARDGAMTWLGVGNVEGVLLMARARAEPRVETLMLRNGVVGLRLPPLQARLHHVHPGDTLVFVTDGIRVGFASMITPFGVPRTIAERILADYHKGTDDSLVLVARYVGETP
jgi:phosphoserine phosphatase RsbX